MSISNQGNTGSREGGVCGGRKGTEEVLRNLNWGIMAFGQTLDFMMAQATWPQIPLKSMHEQLLSVWQCSIALASCASHFLGRLHRVLISNGVSKVEMGLGESHGFLCGFIMDFIFLH